MKKLFFFTVVALLALNANAKVWRLNNNYGVSADFSVWDSAYVHANPNDTIYVEGSQTAYSTGWNTISKPLCIIGTGYFLNENPQTQKIPFSATFAFMHFQTGSSGSNITGIEISTIYIYCGNINFIKNKIGSITFYGNNSYGNIKISNNHINSINSAASTGIKNNIIINNNIIIDNSYAGVISFPDNFSGLITNNSLKAVGINGPSLATNGFVISSNIIYWGTITNLGFNTFANNICNSTQLPTGNGNQLNVDMSTVFAGVTSNSTDGQWQLKAGSPAIGTGINGKDCGAFGGDEPYVLSGMPFIPAVYQITTSGVGTITNGLNVNVKAKTH